MPAVAVQPPQISPERPNRYRLHAGHPDNPPMTVTGDSLTCDGQTFAVLDTQGRPVLEMPGVSFSHFAGQVSVLPLEVPRWVKPPGTDV